MQGNTKKKRGAAYAAAAVIAIILLYLIAIFIAFATVGKEEAFAVMGIGAVYSVVLLAVVLGIFFALRQRFREIDSGEEEEAAKY